MSSGDTINRLLLEGARRHAREFVFAERGGRGGAWLETPDWRADRHAIRVALALGEGLGVGAGDVVALWMPLGLEWPIVERGIWALGAVSLPLLPEWNGAAVRAALSEVRSPVVFCSTGAKARELDRPDATRALVALEGDGEGSYLAFRELMERGGILDTPERATRCRAHAREVGPSAPASLEPRLGVERLELASRTQSDWARAVTRFLARFPVEGQRSLQSTRPDPASRLVLFAGWADGRSRTVLGDDEGLAFGRDAAGMGEGSFVNLSDLDA